MDALRPYTPLPDAVEHGGTEYKLNLSYAAFFAALDAIQDDRLNDYMKLAAALDILIVGKHPTDPELLQKVFDLIKDDAPTPTGPKYMDVIQDWPYICAAFQQAYGINLYANKRMHIMRFKALLQGIPKTTKLAEIIRIRAAEIPQANRHNQKEIAELTRLKAIYALKNGKSLQSGWASLFNVLKSRAKNG